MNATAYPLSWPIGWKRATRRSSDPFGASLGKARDGLLREIKLLGGVEAILSSNLNLRNDGLPYANQRQPSDPGVAVYFQFKRKPMCFACDNYDKIEANVRAIAKTIEALRGIERWGASDMMDRAFMGFASLPSPATSRSFREVLGLVPGADTLADAERAYRYLRSRHHPDRGGDAAAFNAVQRAWEEAQEALR